MQEETCMMKIGMLTSGGDCQALNAAMRGVVKGLTTNVDELEIKFFALHKSIGACCDSIYHFAL